MTQVGKILGKPLILVAALALGACTDAGRFGTGNDAMRNAAGGVIGQSH